MPLTAVVSGGALFDATACSDDDWAVIHKVKPRPVIACRVCQGPVHAKVSRLGLRFFAHDHKRDDCPTTGESAAHLALKRDLAQTIRLAGGTAVVEAMPAPGEQGGWRADVLAIGPTGHRVAFEAQLAPMTAVEGWERTEKYANDGIQTLWVTTKPAPWLYELPSLRVESREYELYAMEGLAFLRDRAWRPTWTLPLVGFVRVWLAGRMSSVKLGHLSGERNNGEYFSRHAPLVNATAKEVEEWAVLEAEEQQRQAKLKAEAEARAAHIQALYERQERVLQVCAPLVAAATGPEDRVWLGVPPSVWDGNLPVWWRSAVGNEKTGQGAAIWTGPHKDALTLRAVICPVASRVNPGLWASWHKRGVTVYAETDKEVGRLSRALGCGPGDITVVQTTPMTPSRTTAVPLPPEDREALALADAEYTASRQDRQHRALQVVVPMLAAEAGGPENLWLGKPLTRWNGQLPVRREQAAGDKRFGREHIMWVSTRNEVGDPTLRAVVCPTAGVAGPNLGKSWRENGVQVFVDSVEEAARLAPALGYEVGELTVVNYEQRPEPEEPGGPPAQVDWLNLPPTDIPTTPARGAAEQATLWDD